MKKALLWLGALLGAILTTAAAVKWNEENEDRLFAWAEETFRLSPAPTPRTSSRPCTPRP